MIGHAHRARLRDYGYLLAAGWLLSVAVMVGWSLLPMAWGWRPTVVLTGSMGPHLRPGDVVLVDPTSHYVGRGSIVVVKDASVPAGSVVHRVTGTDASGMLITKGDANPTVDVVHRDPGDVTGVARLVVPTAGRMALLRNHAAGPSDWTFLAVTGLCLGILARGPSPDCD